ncbi:MAG: hypothetical protein NTZ18_04105 [Candidatus Komeilibacteria bacterium]|nr:hypothetical protein [Candidatus Komeilibacteria bacterium]
MKKKLLGLEAIAILVGTTVGAGVLGLPYAIYQAGFLTGMILLVVLFLAVLLVNLQFGEIVLSTAATHQLTGYAEKYLGKRGKYFMFIVAIIGFYGALLIYIIGEGQALAALTGGNAVVYSLLFFLFTSLLVYLGLTVISEVEFLLTSLVLLVVAAIALFSWPHLNWNNFAQLNLSKILLPYGVIFFSFGGLSAIPQMKQVLRGREQQLKKNIIIGTSIPLVIYLLFAFVVIGVSGIKVTEVATVGLGAILGRPLLIFGNLFAIFTMATGFLTLGLALKSTYQFDFKFKPHLSWLLTMIVPLVLFLAGLHDFIKVMGTVGAVAGGLQGLMVCLIYLKLKKHRERMPEYRLTHSPLIFCLLSLLFLGGIVYTLWYL